MKKDGIQTRNRKMSAKSKRHKKTNGPTTVLMGGVSGPPGVPSGHHHHPLDFALGTVVGYDKHYATPTDALNYSRQQLANYMTGAAGHPLASHFMGPAAGGPVHHHHPPPPPQPQGHSFPADVAGSGYIAGGASGNLSGGGMAASSGGVSAAAAAAAAALACGVNKFGSSAFDSQMTGLSGFASNGMIGAVA